ncbi:MAG: GvpL/GvpF family gas vesicle protein [Chloroflexi bacterium]|nr:GvpL/GvpF family gas vesicle protein [Chloroflexota bacterium]
MTAKYLYCIIPCRQEHIFDVEAIGDAANSVHTVGYGGLAVVVSDSPIDRYESTRNNLMAHQRVLEKVMQEFTLLPVRFGVVTEPISPVEDVQRLLRRRFQEFGDLLKEMEDKAELGLKVFWRDEKAVFAEILAENADIRRLRRQLSEKPPEALHFEGVALGRMVKEALERKRRQEAALILACLRPLAERVRENDTLIDRMVLNAAFLVNRGRESEFDQAIGALDERYGGRVAFKYVGITPPYNFVDIVVNWEELRESGNEKAQRGGSKTFGGHAGDPRSLGQG